ncbi:hypothetical protein ACFV3E_13905 [Streptomyces sp. NPDC059718]
MGVPGPEADWEPAPQYQGGKRNPALQIGLWDRVACDFRCLARLDPPLEAFAARLRLSVERSWQDLGDVGVAVFRIGRTEYALHEFDGGPHGTYAWVHHSVDDHEQALDVLLRALGVGRAVIRPGTLSTDPEGA